MARRTVAKLVVDIAANVATFVGDLEKADRRLQKFQRGAEKTGRGLTRGLTLPLAIAAGVAIKLAADAEQTESRFGLAFGGMADEAREFSETMSKALGQNSIATREQMATVGIMARQMGFANDVVLDLSKSVAQLAVDVTSLRGIPDAFQKIIAGLTGEAEALKRFAIFLDEATVKQTLLDKGLLKQGETLTAQQKVLGRYITLLSQTVIDQGNMAQTSNEAANMFRQLKAQTLQAGAELGGLLLPAAVKVTAAVIALVQGVRGLVEWFKNLSPFVRNVAGGLLLFALVVGPTILGVTKLVGAIRLLRFAMLSTVNPIVAVGVALASIAAVAGIVALNARDAEQAAVDVEKWKISLEGAEAAFRNLSGAGAGGDSPMVKLAEGMARVSAEAQVFGEFQGMAARMAGLHRTAIVSLLEEGLHPLDAQLVSLTQRYFEFADAATAAQHENDAALESFREMERSAQQLGDSIDNSLTSAFQSMVSSLFTVLATAEKGWQDLNAAVLGIIGGMLQQLGVALIAFGKAGAAIRAFINNPVASVIAGVTLIALGAALSAAASNIVSVGGNTLAGGGGAPVAPQAPSLGGESGSGPGGQPIIINFDPADGVVIMNPNNPRSLEQWIKMFEAASGQRYVARPSGGQIQFLPRGA